MPHRNSYLIGLVNALGRYDALYRLYAGVALSLIPLRTQVENWVQVCGVISPDHLDIYSKILLKNTVGISSSQYKQYRVASLLRTNPLLCPAEPCEQTVAPARHDPRNGGGTTQKLRSQP